MKSPTIFSFTPSLMNAADLESIFVQREAIVADLVERIRESVLTPTKHHSLIIGARGMGKTHLVSLVYHRVQAMADLQERILIAWLREEEWGITSFLKLLLRILRSIDPSDPAIQQRVEALYELSSADAEQAAMSLLTEIIGDRTLLLITENLDDLFKGLGEQGQQKLRAFLQNSDCCTILATAPRLFNGVQSRTKPFYGFFRPVRLQELTAAEAVQLLIQIASLREQTELVSFLNTPIGKARVQAVEHLAGGNPRIYVIFAEFLSRESLEELVQPFMALLDVLTPYYQSRMQYLSAQQREIVEFLCDRKYPATVKDIAQRCFITSQTTSSQLKELKEKGYVNVESIGRESFYALQEPLMRICLGMKKERDSMLKFIVDFLRTWYSKDELDALRQKASDEFMQEYLELALQESNTNEQDPRIAIYGEQIKDCLEQDLSGEALQYTQKLISIRGSVANWIQQIIILAKSNQWEKALISCENALAIEFNNHILLSLKACCLFKTNRYTEAVNIYSKTMEYQSDDFESCLLHGISLGKLNLHEEAISIFDRAVKFHPDNDLCLSMRGIALVELGRHEEAISSFDRVKLQPDDPAYWLLRSNSLFELGRYEETISSLDRAIELQTDDPEPMCWNLRGVSLFELGRHEEAMRSLDRSIEIDPYNFECANNRAESLLANNYWNKGKEAIKNVLNHFQEVNEPYDNNIEPVLNGLLTQDSSQWKSRITDLISWFEPFPTAVTNGLVSACKKMISFRISDTTATLWHDTWHELTHHLPEYQLPLRLLTTALHYKQKPDDPRVWMELSIEERKILQQALGIDSVESRD
jgi:tetratricopeptide (TPR) repeat protein